MADSELTSFLEDAGAGDLLRIENDYGNGFYRLRVSEAQRRQALQDIRSNEDVLLEMLRNARDSNASRVFVASFREEDKRHLVVIDDGEGIPESMHALIFEPRVTSKLDSFHEDNWGVHGRGMALYSIRENSEVARVRSSEIGRGSAIEVVSDTSRLSERSDQSTFPNFILEESGRVSVRGPKNLLRIATEFALEERRALRVYFGSPVEILSTIYALGSLEIPENDRVFGVGRDAAPLWLVPTYAFSEEELCAAASRIGLDVSTRSARRVIDGELDVLDPLLVRVQKEGFVASSSSRSPGNSQQASLSGESTNDDDSIETLRVTLRQNFTKEERETLARGVLDCFADIAESHYLSTEVEPIVRVSRDSLVVRIPLVPDDLR